MGKERADMGRLDRRALLPVIEAAFHRAWNGVIRLRNGHRIGAVWMVKGHVVHAIMLQDGARTEGPAALESISTWSEGTYFLDPGALPPARTIRLDAQEMLKTLRRLTDSETPSIADAGVTASLPALNEMLETLRARVPGLESLSVSRGATVEASTAADAAETEWLNGQLRRYCSDILSSPERLLLQDGDHTLLIVKKGQMAAVLSARGTTTLEALLWAGEEAQKEVLERSGDLSVTRNS
jgi:hypothetical protein